MAGFRLSRDLAKQIAELGAKTVSRVVRLAPTTSSAYLRLIQRSGNDKEVIAAVERYLVVARRAEKHADDATKKLFDAAHERLAARLEGIPGKDMDFLRGELKARRLAVLPEPEDVVAARKRRPARAAQVSHVPDPGAVLLFRGFLDRLRAVAALGDGKWDHAQRLLMTGRRKLLAAVGGEWAGGWEATFTYLRNHATKIAARARTLRSAQKALDDLRKSGTATTTALRAAEDDVRRAGRALDGFLSKVKGLLGEAYVPRWKTWNLMMDGYLEVARREARALGRGWEPQRVVGGLWVDGAEAWDEAILLVNRQTGEAKLFLAAQYKVEKQVSALKQAQNDLGRETAIGADKLPTVTFTVDDVVQSGFKLTPMPVGKASHRFVFNAAGGRVSAADIERLRQAGIEVHQLHLDVSVAEFDQVGRALVDVVADTVP